jgi:hypothetical protein
VVQGFDASGDGFIGFAVNPISSFYKFLAAPGQPHPVPPPLIISDDDPDDDK